MRDKPEKPENPIEEEIEDMADEDIYKELYFFFLFFIISSN